MIEINLVPDVKQELIWAQRTRNAVVTFSIFTGVAALAVVALLAFYVYGVQTVRGAFLDQGIKDSSDDIAQFEDLSKVLTIQNQLGVIDTLNDTRQQNSRIFDMLSAVVPPAPNEVRVAAVAVDTETAIMEIEGQTADYGSIEIFKKTLEGAVIEYPLEDGTAQTDMLATMINISEISYGEDSNGANVVRFTLDFVYPDSLFSAAISNVSFQLTNEGNVTDSYLGVPRSLFVTTSEEDEE